jgi:Do/DeqQ family serine protease
MKKKRLLYGGAIAVFAIAITVVFACRGVQGAFGNGDSNPIAKMDETSRLLDTQKVLRAIHDTYDERVVFITTEQMVKIPNNPFMDDDFFGQFFNAPNQGRGSNGNQQRTQKRTGLGSGFIVSEDGYICTNYHVVNGADKVFVKIKGKDYQAEVIGTDDRTDIALIKVKDGGKFKPVFLGNSGDVSVGDWAIAIGNPYGLQNTFTVGFVSATGRKDPELLGGAQTFIQTDAPINPGNSGGPLINIKGEVIGMNTAIISQSGGNVGIGLAVPINTVKDILEQLKVNKKIKRGYFGVYLVPLNEEYAKELGLPDNKGAIAGRIEKGSPAEKAGMRVKDVILKVNNKKIEDVNELVEIAGNSPIGKTVEVLIWRDKAELTLFLTVKERP